MLLTCHPPLMMEYLGLASHEAASNNPKVPWRIWEGSQLELAVQVNNRPNERLLEVTNDATTNNSNPLRFTTTTTAKHPTTQPKWLPKRSPPLPLPRPSLPAQPKPQPSSPPPPANPLAPPTNPPPAPAAKCAAHKTCRRLAWASGTSTSTRRRSA